MQQLLINQHTFLYMNIFFEEEYFYKSAKCIYIMFRKDYFATFLALYSIL